MAKKKQGSASNSTDTGDDGDKKTRSFADYTFEEHLDDGTVKPLGLTLNYPREAVKVTEYLEKHREELGIEGKIRVCKKIYS